MTQATRSGGRIERRKTATSDLVPRRRSTDGATTALSSPSSTCPSCDRPLPIAEYVPFCSACKRPFQPGETFYQHATGPRCASCMIG